MFLTRLTNQGKPMTEVKVVSPPPMNTMEQLLAVQNAISKIEELVQDANIVLLKIRALLLAFPSQVYVSPHSPLFKELFYYRYIFHFYLYLVFVMVYSEYIVAYVCVSANGTPNHVIGRSE